MEHRGEVPPSHLKASWASSRKCLFGIMEELVLWENTINEAVLEKARAEIRKSLREVCELNKVLPEALDDMTRGSGNDRSPVAPVDLSQAIIGPGMAVFSKYAAVLEADGTPMSVRTALQLINRFLAEDDFDADSQFCLHWFEQYGWKEGALALRASWPEPRAPAWTAFGKRVCSTLPVAWCGCSAGENIPSDISGLPNEVG
ncbi:hypothetical protein DSTSK_03720 [Desulforhabdus sp. TSK]|nr:hypothetical protein [Desulforhabdus sp. TSK]GKT07067.1 hypothetical protein DSTSK_03720 [Desulforhabdus sp. TSK]